MSVKLLTGLLTIVAAVLAIVWLLWRWMRKSDDPVGVAVRILLSLGIAVPLLVFAARANDEFGKIAAVLFAATGGILFTILWGPAFCNAVARLFTNLYDGGDIPPDPVPLYSIAESRRKAGKHHEAIAAIREQLERFPGDFHGQMMLAQIHAENLDDLPSAERIVYQLIGEEGRPHKNIFYALSCLADWNLKLGDLAAARQALQTVVEILPDTEYANLATQRLAHIIDGETAVPGERRIMHVVETTRHLGLETSATPRDLIPDASNRAELAAAWVAHLDQHPQDNEVREKLALLYAEQYERPELAIDRLEQLATAPNQPHKLVARYLNLMADVEIKHRHDLEKARLAIHRIIDQFPTTALADNARARLTHLNLEMKGQEKTTTIRLGNYDQNIGLKRT